MEVPTVGLIAIDKVLERMCGDVAAQRGIRIHFTSSHVPRSVPHDVSLALFRAVQEAVNLPKRSARARCASRSPERRAWFISTSVISGRHVSTRPTPVLGLLRMRERVAMVNGKFSMTSPSEGGDRNRHSHSPWWRVMHALIYGGASDASARTE